MLKNTYELQIFKNNSLFAVHTIFAVGANLFPSSKQKMLLIRFDLRYTVIITDKSATEGTTNFKIMVKIHHIRSIEIHICFTSNEGYNLRCV